MGEGQQELIKPVSSNQEAVDNGNYHLLQQLSHAKFQNYHMQGHFFPVPATMVLSKAHSAFASNPLPQNGVPQAERNQGVEVFN